MSPISDVQHVLFAKKELIQWLFVPPLLIMVAPVFSLTVFGLIGCAAIVILRRKNKPRWLIGSATLLAMTFDVMALLMFQKEALGHLRELGSAAPAFYGVITAGIFLFVKAWCWHGNFWKTDGASNIG